MHIDDEVQVGPLLCKLRADSGKSRRQVAKETGLDVGNLKLWEAGTHAPLLRNLLVLFKFYRVRVPVGLPPEPGYPAKGGEKQ